MFALQARSGNDGEWVAVKGGFEARSEAFEYAGQVADELMADRKWPEAQWRVLEVPTTQVIDLFEALKRSLEGSK